MVITVEPGIYVGEAVQAPEAYRGIGVRIEDDVLITESGPRVLTQSIPKAIDELERACAR
jgi:Xaa-Pro aminopeptidase